MIAGAKKFGFKSLADAVGPKMAEKIQITKMTQKYVGKRAKQASRSNTRRGHHWAYSNCALCDRFGVASLRDAIFV